MRSTKPTGRRQTRLILAIISTLAAAAVILVVTIAAWIVTIGWLKLVTLIVLVQ